MKCLNCGKEIEAGDYCSYRCGYNHLGAYEMKNIEGNKVIGDIIKKEKCMMCGSNLTFRRKKWSRAIDGNIWTNYYCENCGNHE